jgi:hypothetical protein
MKFRSKLSIIFMLPLIPILIIGIIFTYGIYFNLNELMKNHSQSLFEIEKFQRQKISE